MMMMMMMSSYVGGRGRNKTHIDIAILGSVTLFEICCIAKERVSAFSVYPLVLWKSTTECNGEIFAFLLNESELREFLIKIGSCN
jgi:hypothetical protein